MQSRGPGMPQECFEMFQIHNLANGLWAKDATEMLLGGQRRNQANRVDEKLVFDEKWCFA